jgi:heat shock protein HslJ
MKYHHARPTFNFLITLLVLPIAQNAIAGDPDTAMSALKNATYNGIGEQPVTLSQGRWEGAPYEEGGASRPAVGLVDDFLLRGDLDADGKNELVVMLWQSSAGTGSNEYIAVMKPGNGGYVNLATALLGDRVKLRSGRIESGHIVLDVLQAGGDDPMCCPTELAERTWRLDDGQLEEQPMQVTGKLSVNALDGSHWRMTDMNIGQPLPQDVEVTLSFEANRMSGKSACNRYSAKIEDGERPGELVIGPAMVTRKACPEPLMEYEMHFLDALSLVQSFSFHAGKLALNGQADDGTPFSMLFATAAGDTP